MLQLSVCAFVGGSIAGLLFTLCELSRWKPVAVAFQGYGVVMRSVPELLVIFLFYYGGSLVLQQILGIFDIDRYVEINAFVAGVIALGLIQSAYASEVFKGAIREVPHGLLEASRSLGLARLITFRKVTMPLAIRYAAPGLSNLWINLIKNTALVSAIGLEDMVRVAITAGHNTKQYFLFYLIVLVAYLVLVAISMMLQSMIENRVFRFASEGRL